MGVGIIVVVQTLTVFLLGTQYAVGGVKFTDIPDSSTRGTTIAPQFPLPLYKNFRGLCPPCSSSCRGCGSTLSPLSFCIFLYFVVVFVVFCLFEFLPLCHFAFCLFVFLSFCHHYQNHGVHIYCHTNFCSKMSDRNQTNQIHSQIKSLCLQ